MIYDVKKTPLTHKILSLLLMTIPSLGVYFTLQTVSLSICIYYNLVIIRHEEL